MRGLDGARGGCKNILEIRADQLAHFLRLAALDSVASEISNPECCLVGVTQMGAVDNDDDGESAAAAACAAFDADAPMYSLADGAFAVPAHSGFRLAGAGEANGSKMLRQASSNSLERPSRAARRACITKSTATHGQH
jgi:hypothetical protein